MDHVDERNAELNRWQQEIAGDYDNCRTRFGGPGITPECSESLIAFAQTSAAEQALRERMARGVE